MAKMAATGITEPAAGLLQTLKLALSYCTIPYAFPQELKDSYPSTDIFEIMIVRIT
jgi:hypothetical protein